MDYKELIEDLRHAVDLICVSNLYVSCENELRDAATAIETLLAERDAAMKDLRGYCRTCIHANISQPDYPCIKCKHLEFYGTQEIDGWQWRGPQKEPAP